MQKIHHNSRSKKKKSIQINKLLKMFKPTSLIPQYSSYTHSQSDVTKPGSCKPTYQLFLEPPTCTHLVLEVWALQLQVYLCSFLKSAGKASLEFPSPWTSAQRTQNKTETRTCELVQEIILIHRSRKNSDRIKYYFMYFRKKKMKWQHSTSSLHLEVLLFIVSKLAL